MTQKCADFLVLFLFGLILIVLLALYAGGYLILGGEGNYFLDFTTAAKSGCYTWNSLMMGTGGIQPTPHFFFGIFDLFSFLRSLSLSLKTVNLISVFLVYFLPFAAMYLVLRRVLKIRLLHASLGALFYLLNPISTYHLSSAMFWNCAPNFVLPVTFGLIYKYFDDSRRLFIYFGLFSFLVSFCFSNIPYLGVFHISIFIFLWIASMILRNRVDLKRMIVNFICLEVSFVLFNAWWFLPLVQFQLQSVASFYHADSAVEWAKYAVGDGLMMNKLFSLTTLVPYFWSRHFNEYFFTRFYYHPGVRIFLLIPFMLLAFGLLQRNLRWKKSLPWIAFFILGVVFLNKGYNDPFKDAYIFLMEHIPFFTLFKSPLEKFGVLLIFLLALYLGLLLKGDRKGWMSMPLILYLVVCSLPYWTLNFMPDSEITDGKYVSSKFVYKPEYQAAVRKINEVPGEGRVLSLPGSHNYGVTLLNHENKYYQGMDPILYALNKGFVAAYSRLFNLNFDVLFRSISKPFFHRLLSLYHINQVMINKDLYPRFGFLEKETLQEMEDIFNNSQIYSKDQTISGAISLYDLKDEYVLPHIYGAVHGFWIEGSLAFLLPLAQSPLFEQPVAWVFPEWQNQEVLHEGWKDILSEKWSQILLVNRRFNDWVLEGLKGEALFETSQRKVGIEAIGTHGVCALTLSDLESEYFEVKKSGIYEVWIRSKEGSKDTDWNLIQVDSVILEQMDAKNRMGWQKSGEVRLEKGGHQVCKGVLGHYVKMCRQGEYEVVFCPRERFEELAQKLKGKDISYLFCPQEKQGIQSFDIALRCDQSYDLMGQFSRKETFKKTGEKFVKVYLAPFLKKGRFYKGLQGVRKMQVQAMRCSYRSVVKSSSWKIHAYFDGTEDEFVKIQYLNPGPELIGDEGRLGGAQWIDLNKYPYLALKYKVQDPSVQTIQVVFRVKTQGTGGLERSLVPVTSYPKPASAKKDTFIVDLLRKAREVLPGEKHYYLTSLEILPHKIWGVDCSKGKKGEYDFVLYDIGMFQHLDVDLQQDLPTKSYAYEDEGKVYGVGSLFEIPRDKKFSFQVHKRQFLNLNDMNHWNLFLKDYSGRHVRAIFGFGLAGEKKESSQLEREFSVVSLNKGISFVNIDFREILDARKNWKNWELQWMELVAPHQKKNRWRYRVESYLFEQKIRRLEAFDFGLDPVKLFSLNGTPVDIPQGKIKRVDENCFQFRLDPLKFQKRFQKLRFLTNPRLTCDWLLFRPGLEREQRLPEIDFRKINPTRYVVRVQKSDQPFWLVFSESFHPNWRAYVRKVNDLTQNGRGQFLEFDEPSSALLSLLRDRGRRIELKRHFAANGYLNTWWVDPKDLGTQLEIERQNESFEIILEFTSQRALEVGWIISGTVLLFCLLGFYLMKRKNRC